MVDLFIQSATKHTHTQHTLRNMNTGKLISNERDGKRLSERKTQCFNYILAFEKQKQKQKQKKNHQMKCEKIWPVFVVTKIKTKKKPKKKKKDCKSKRK